MTSPNTGPDARPPPQTALGFFLHPARRSLASFGFGLAAIGLAWILVGANGIAPSYLAAWLCLLALPAGALPVVIMIERADAWRPQPETALLETLRWQLSLMPVVAILAAPILLLAPALFPWALGAPKLTAPWYDTAFVILRISLSFAIWIGLALFFARRSGEAGRRDDARALVGLGLHLLVGTLVANDLVMAGAGPVDAGLAGLLLMAGWSSLALSAAIMVAPPDVGPSRRRLDRLTPLAVLQVIWAMLHVLQIMSADSAPMSLGTAWYGQRDGPEARALALVAGLVVLLAAALTARPGENRTRIVAALSLAVHLAEMSWFVTPSLRGSFKVSLPDLLMLAGMVGLAAGLVPPAVRLLRMIAAIAGGSRRF